MVTPFKRRDTRLGLSIRQKDVIGSTPSKPNDQGICTAEITPDGPAPIEGILKDGKVCNFGDGYFERPHKCGKKYIKFYFILLKLSNIIYYTNIGPWWT